MVMNKGDSVLVSGFSYIGTDEEMKSVQAQEGDAMIHHVVVTIGGDTTQGLTHTNSVITHYLVHI